MKTILFFSVLLAGLALSSGAWAQQSANYQLKTYDLNAGGDPVNGAPLTSTNTHCTVSSIGDGLAATEMTSGSYKASVGFPATTSPSPSACLLSCVATVPASGNTGSPIAFAATATPTNCTGDVTFAWTFGDGGTSTSQNPSHSYASAGTFAWTLTASVQGATCSKSGSITITGGGLPGDCDGNGTVSIGEVQKAINMFLETQAPGCGVDCNGDGTVSIGEVQKIINGFLGVASSC